MHSKLGLTPLAACMLFTMASSINAAQPLPLHKGSLPALQQQFHLGLPGVKKAVVASKDVLQFVGQHTDKNRVTHTRLQQHYSGFLVHGGYAILHTKKQANALLTGQDDANVNGVVYRDLQKDLGDVAPDFVSNGNKALMQFVAPFPAQNVSEQTVTPMVYIDDQNQAHWAYKVSALLQQKKQIPARPTAIIDAKTFKPLIQWNDIKTIATPVKGQGYGGNSKVGEIAYGLGSLPYLELTRNDSEETCSMENTDVKVIDMAHRYSSPKIAMTFPCRSEFPGQTVFLTGYEGDGYDRDNGAFSPTNDALYAGYVIKHMYHDWYDVEALTKSDGSPMQLVMRVHYGDEYANAYWDGRQMTFGDGDWMMYPLVSLGVGSHEVSHGFTEQHSSLEYYSHSGGMNESFSDMAAQAAEFYSTGHNTWQIGPEIMKEDSGYDALRYMDMPSKDGESIDTATDYYSGLDVHYSSGVFNRLFYLMSTKPGWDVRKAFDVMVKANMDYWTPYSTFNQGGCGVLYATNDLGYSVEDVKAALTSVAIKYESCMETSPDVDLS